MTREEAITYLNVIWNRYKAEYEIERETLDAYHMAIEALSANDEINEMNKEIIKDILKMMPTAYLLEALGVDTVDELMKPADAVSREVYDTIEPNKIYCSPQLAHNVEVVVRCKDCMHRHECECPMYHEEWFTIDEGDGYVDDDYNVIDKTVDDGFCQYGERREP